MPAEVRCVVRFELTFAMGAGENLVKFGRNISAPARKR